jgi:hypothetical protein
VAVSGTRGDRNNEDATIAVGDNNSPQGTTPEPLLEAELVNDDSPSSHIQEQIQSRVQQQLQQQAYVVRQELLQDLVQAQVMEAPEEESDSQRREGHAVARKRRFQIAGFATAGAWKLIGLAVALGVG